MDKAVIRAKYEALKPELTERSRRLWAATEAKAIGWGGIALVSRATGVSDVTIWHGLKDLESGETLESGRVRRPGAGRKRITETDPTLLEDLKSLVEPTVSGDPESPLLWTYKSTRKLAAELQAMGHTIGDRKVAGLLREQGYTLQSNKKAQEGKSHPDRDGQFRYIQKMVEDFQNHCQPVISVDCKKKELVGNFKNAGKEWRPKGSPERVKVHDFMVKELGKAIPYGIYDPTNNTGWVSVGVDHETSKFAVRTIRRWWQVMGKKRYPKAKSILITADSGGSNGARVRLWKKELQELADKSGLSITVLHYPPGTSKWNKIEHRLFSYISMNWRGKPLTSLATIVNLIAATTTKTGLRVRAEIDKGKYPKGIKVSEKEMFTLNLQRHDTYGDWNYTIKPRRNRYRHC
jgi:hypothetical protein